MPNSAKSQQRKSGGGSRLQVQSQNQPLGRKRNTASSDASDKSTSEQVESNEAQKISKKIPNTQLS